MLMIVGILIRPVSVGAGETFYKPTNILHRVSWNPNSKSAPECWSSDCTHETRNNSSYPRQAFQKNDPTVQQR